FHAVDVPAWDPLKLPTPKQPTRTNTKIKNPQQEEEEEEEDCPMEWIPFSKRDSTALEAAFKLK
ncbi:10973_t:CDS:1, partial [Acaulospora morrowiae]